MPGFLPGGLIQTAAQAVAVGARRRSSSTGRRRRKRTRGVRAAGTKRRSRTRSARRTSRPKPGTKAWMAYIRTKRRK